MSKNNVDTNNEVTSETSAIWKNHVSAPNTPDGFTLRTTFPANPDGVEVMLEKWEAGTEEPAHSHPGDDMTVVIEGKMSIQFFTDGSAGLVPDGDRIFLSKGEAGYIKGEEFMMLNTSRNVNLCTFMIKPSVLQHIINQLPEQ